MQHTESLQLIYKSSEYSRFRLIGGNRQLNQLKINRIIRAIRNGLDMLKECPVIVVDKNDKLEVIDGQHRFWVSKTLKAPVYYTIRKEPISLKQIAILNSNSERWKNNDYINCYIQQDMNDYKLIQDFLDQYGIPLSTSLRLLSYGGISRNSGLEIGLAFKTGDFKVKAYDQAVKVAEKMKLFYRYPNRKSKQFLGAITTLIEQKRDIEYMAEVSNNGADILHCKTISEYVDQLNESFSE